MSGPKTTDSKTAPNTAEMLKWVTNALKTFQLNEADRALLKATT